jgi:RecB family exonuclease
MPLTPTLLLVPSVSAGQILLRRLAREKRATAAISAMRPKDLALKMAEGKCHALGLLAWQSGHGALLAAKLLASHPELLKPGLPEAPVARVLARTLEDLRAAGIRPGAVRRLAERGPSPEDRSRLSGVAKIYERYHAEIDSKFFDETRLFAEAETAEAPFLLGTTVLLSPDLEPRPDEFRFLKSLAARFGAHRIEGGESRIPGGFSMFSDEARIPTVPWAETVFAPVARPSTEEITRLTDALFEAPGPSPRIPALHSAVSWVTAPGEASEVRSIARLVLKAAREGMPFDDMAVALPQPDIYAPILVDLFSRAKIPFKLHPSLPLASGRIARSFLLLLGSRDFDRGSLLEFLTFAPVPLADKTGDPDPPHPSVFDQITRELKVVSGIDRFRKALHHFISEETKASATLSEGHRASRGRRVKAARALLTLVEKLQLSLAFTSEKLPLDQWSTRLLALCNDWIRPESEVEETERQLVCETLEELSALAAVSSPVSFDRVLSVIEAQFDRKRRPLEERSRVGVHVGSPEALSGGRFRFVALLGLVEGRFPGVFRPDPFLLDPERKALSDEVAAVPPPRAVTQLSLFDEEPTPVFTGGMTLPTTDTRVAQVRRMFARTLRQAEERLVLSYPRADEQTGRERLPSLFLMAALQAFKGVTVNADDLHRIVTEDEDGHTDTDLSIDLGERDTEVVARHGLAAVSWLEAERPFLRAAHELSRGRGARRLSPYDGLVGREDADSDPRLDPVKSGQAISASRIAAFSECGFRYFLRYVLKLEPAIEPEERRKLDPLEKGTLFHEVAELFLRERRDADLLPIRNTEEERQHLLALGDERLEAWVEGSPPRLVLLWRAEKKVFSSLLTDWLAREAESYRTKKTIPAHFEVSFGMPYRRPDTKEPHRDLPVEIPLDDGSVLRISGQIDRIDRIDAADGGGLVLRDYKTGKAPTDSDASLFKGGRQLQIPFYILAAQEIFPGEKVVEAFLDYVNGGRPVAFPPAKATSATFRALLLRIADLMGHGVFMQEPSACTFCDFKSVCGPNPVLESRKRRRRIHDPLARKVAELKQFA